MPDVSIVIPVYIETATQAKWLDECLKAAVSASGPSREIILVDDASKLFPRFDAYKDVRIVEHEVRRGAGAARNSGIAAATADYILCLDADDILLPDGLAVLWDARCQTGVVYGDLEYIGDRRGIHQLPEWDLADLLKFTAPNPITALHRREWHQAVGGFDESMAGLEDVDYWIKLAKIGICGKHIPRVTFQYRRHARSRQAGLEADNHKRLREIHEVLSARYRSLIMNPQPTKANCRTCPGGTGPGLGVSHIAEGVGPDGVLMQYVGLLQGSFTANGFATGIKYYVDGKGATLLVHPNDVQQLLARQTVGRPDFIIVQQTPETEFANTADLAAADYDNPPPALSDITSMSAKDAIHLVGNTSELLDLQIWLAAENAREGGPRSTVIKALESRIDEVTTGQAVQDG